jgi:flagellar protein FliO/FliZ
MKRVLSGIGLMLCSAAVAALEQGPKSEAPRLLTDGLGDTAIGLLLVLGLIAALAWGLRRFGRVPLGGRGAVQVLGGVSLGNRERAVLLSVDGTRLLVGVAPGQVRTLHVLGKTGQQDDFAAELDHAREGETA